MPEEPLTTGRAAYLEIADRLRSRIAAGAYTEGGGQLPSGSVLRDAFGVSLETIRKALDILKAEGLITGQAGIGVFVRQRGVSTRSAANRYTRAAWAAGTSAGQVDLGPNAARHQTDMSTVGEEQATGDVAARMGVEVGTPVIARRRRNLEGNKPFQYAVSYLPLSIVAGTQAAQLNSGPGGSWARIEEKGWRFTRVTEDVEARMPTFDEAQRLQSLPSSPIFVIHRVSYGVDVDNREVVLDYSVIELPCESRVLRYELPVN